MMHSKSLLLATLLPLIASMPTLAQDTRYLHTHQGTVAQAQNQDTNFGSPAVYKRNHHARQNVELVLTASGVALPQSVSVERRTVVNFDIRNSSPQDLLLVIGDDRAIAETQQRLSSAPEQPAADFHAIRIEAGQAAQLAWRFDTFATSLVKLAVIDRHGQLAPRVLTVKVGPRELRNHGWGR